MLVDINIVSDIVENHLKEDFFLLLKDRKLSACVTLSILLEMAKTNDSCKRKKFLQFIRDDVFEKLRSDDDLECEEVIQEVKRAFPQYYQEKNILKAQKRRKYHLEQLWQECILKHEDLHNQAMQISEIEGKITVDIQKKNKESFKEWNIDKIKLNEMKAIFDEDKGWIISNEGYELWRIDSFCAFYNFYMNPSPNSHLIKFWLDAYLDMNSFIHDKQNYHDFWFMKARRDTMKVQWLRWAIKFVQQFKKIKDSNPFDELHTAYLVKVQYFVTADKLLYDCLKRIKKDKVIDFADPILIKVNNLDIMDQLRNKLNFS